ncbi:hypothetical protein C8J26_2600 [Sphingomonas aurantiaca]|uniref:Uncharacterized protein n=1 Tax=Sphingomonas aurantiaca TaxID=185949 RepID=A0A2T5GK87_9SPHN|nr:hypothetical protein [Sphingomonas aurantiaca]PTQ59748.1 hypothetical protein C8J26_2600 [Sphingomonas aurantiaca]
MKKIYLIGAAPVGGNMHFPSEGVIETSPAEADDLVKAGLARFDDLDSLKVDELRTVALNESVAVGPAILKDDLITAIRARRQNKS